MQGISTTAGGTERVRMDGEHLLRAAYARVVGLLSERIGYFLVHLQLQRACDRQDHRGGEHRPGLHAGLSRHPKVGGGAVGQRKRQMHVAVSEERAVCPVGARVEDAEDPGREWDEPAYGGRRFDLWDLRGVLALVE